MPHYVIDAPGGGGKIPLLPDYVTEVNDHEVVLRNYAGKTYQYPQVASDDPSGVTVGTDGSVGSDGTTATAGRSRRIPEPIAHLD